MQQEIEREIGSIKSDSTKQDSSWGGGKSMLTFWPKEEKKQFGKEEYFNELLVVKLHNKHQICVVTFVGKFLPSLTKLTIKTSKAEILLSSMIFSVVVVVLSAMQMNISTQILLVWTMGK